MIEFVNKMTGTRMWVADNRVDEYKAAGHTLAADITPEEKPTKPREKKTKEVRNDEVRDSRRS